jgi:hypothetical protein
LALLPRLGKCWATTLHSPNTDNSSQVKTNAKHSHWPGPINLQQLTFKACTDPVARPGGSSWWVQVHTGCSARAAGSVYRGEARGKHTRWCVPTTAKAAQHANQAGTTITCSQPATAHSAQLAEGGQGSSPCGCGQARGVAHQPPLKNVGRQVSACRMPKGQIVS